MGDFIDVTIKHGSTDISSKVLSFTRNSDICTGISTLELVIITDSDVIDLWDLVTVTENGHKKGEFYVSGNERNVKGGTRRITAQDGSKLLADYFIADSYTIDYESYTGYWIDKFLTEAGVSHSAIATGVALSPNTQLGLSSAYDTIQTLLQYSGWYIYFDGDNTAHVGSMTVHSGNPTKLTDSSIRSVTTNKNDSMLRNRAVVWGNYDVVASGYIFADNSVSTPWNYDSTDKRAVVVSNSSIYSQADADELSRKMLSEFAKINSEKTVEVIGEVNVTVGSFVNVKSKGWLGSGLVTTIDVSFSSGGLITTLVLDQRCPRLFAYWGDLDDYVYIGTTGAGIWRKPISESGWTDYSTAIPSGDLNITDLYINNQIFGTITDSGNLYYKQYDDPWNLYTPSGIVDENAVTVSGLVAKALTINHQTNNLIVGYNNELTDDYSRSWVLEITPSGELVRSDQVYIASGDYSTHIIDLDTNDLDNVISVGTGGTIYLESLGTRTNTWGREEDDSTTILPESLNLSVYKDTDYVSASVTVTGYTTFLKPILQYSSADRIYAYYRCYRTYGTAPRNVLRRYKFTPHDGTPPWLTTSYVDISGPTWYGSAGYLYKEDENDNIVYCTGMYENLGVTHFYHEVYDFSDSSYDWDYSVTYDYSGKGIIDTYQMGSKIYRGFYSISGTTLTASYFSYDQLTQAIVTNSVSTTISGDGITSIGLAVDIYGDFPNASFAPNKDGTECIFSFIFYTNNNKVGVIYGDLNSLSSELLYSKPAELAGILSNYKSYAQFAGDTKTNTGIQNAYGFFIRDGTTYNYAAAIRMYYDDSLNVTILESHKDGPMTNAEANDYINNESVYAGGQFSSKFLSTPYILSSESSGTVLKLYNALTLDAVVTKTVAELGNGISAIDIIPDICHYDFDDIMFISVYRSGADNLASIDTDGNLIHIYEDIDTSGNVFISNGFLITGTSYQAATFLYPSSGSYYHVSGGLILRQQKEIFTPILTVTDLYQVEISKPSPIEVFNITGSGGILPIYQAETASGEFSTITPLYETYDGRVFDIQSPSSFVIASGIVGSGLRYFALASDEGLKAFPTNLEDEGITIFPSSCYHLETTNNTTNPYLFVTTSGDNPIFWEREPTASGFIDYSATLPSGVDITIIRTDDRL